jgi:RNA polymerase sigma-70 factor (ECF subfamily)
MNDRNINGIGGNLSGEALTKTIEGAMRGDMPSFEALYRKYIDYIFYQCKALLHDKENVDDAVSETVLNLYRSMPKLRNPLAFYAFISRITANTCHNFNRKRRVATTNIEDYEDTLMTDEGIPENELESAERVVAVREAMEKLPEKQRLCLFMYYYCDMAYKDIAEALKITQRTVGTNIMKAKRKMKTFLNDAAFGTAVSGAVAADLASALPPLRKEALFAVCGAKISAALPASLALGSMHIGHIGHIGQNIGAGVSAVKVTAAFTAVVTLSGGAYAVNAVVSDAPVQTAAAPAIIQELPPYAAGAKIVFANAEGFSGKRNPVNARLEIESSKVLDWNVERADGEIIASGSGNYVGEETLNTLAPGDYTVIWEAQDEYGRTAHIYREFSKS